MIFAERNNRQVLAALIVVVFLAVFSFFRLQLQSDRVVTRELTRAEMLSVEGGKLDSITKGFLITAAVVGITVGVVAITGGLAGPAAPVIAQAAWIYVGSSYVNASLAIAGGVAAGAGAYAGR